MDRVRIANLDKGGRPLQIRSGHTPVNVGLVMGSMLAAIAAAANSAARSKIVDQVLPTWAMWTFYAVLFISAATTLSAIWRPLPTHLDVETYHVIVSRLVRERVGLYGVAGIMFCFSAAAMTGGLAGATATCWLTFIAGGLVMRARQTSQDVEKLHLAVIQGDSAHAEFVAENRPRPDRDEYT